jgi:ubiquitin carboxyl-terminal hydrolase 8
MSSSSQYDFHKHHNLVTPKTALKKKGLCGLVNLGNTCYLNSTIQCLSHTLKLTDYFLSRQNQKDDPNNMNKSRPEHLVVRCWMTLLDNLWENNQLIKPRSFRDSISKFVKKYSRSHQQDSHECLMYILDLLHKGLSYEIDVDILGNPKTEADHLYKKSLEDWTSWYKDNYSPIIEYFYGQSKTDITCIHCKTKNVLFEPYCGLSVPVKSNSSIKECINQYLEKAVIDTWKCESCDKIGCEKSNALWTIPNYLVLTLNRFDNKNRKINDVVQFEEQLDLTEFISKDKSDPNKYKYQLYAINCHTGNTNGGHYYSITKNLDGNWYMMNDSNITKHNNKNLVTSDAYLLFYYRTFIK